MQVGLGQGESGYAPVPLSTCPLLWIVGAAPPLPWTPLVAPINGVLDLVPANNKQKIALPQ